MNILFEDKSDMGGGQWKVLWMDYGSVVLEDVSCESHRVRIITDFFAFRDNWRIVQPSR